MLDNIDDFTVDELKDPVVKEFAIDNILQERIKQIYLKSKRDLTGEETTELRASIIREIDNHIQTESSRMDIKKYAKKRKR